MGVVAGLGRGQVGEDSVLQGGSASAICVVHGLSSWWGGRKAQVVDAENHNIQEREGKAWRRAKPSIGRQQTHLRNKYQKW